MLLNYQVIRSASKQKRQTEKKSVNKTIWCLQTDTTIRLVCPIQHVMWFKSMGCLHISVLHTCCSAPIIQPCVTESAGQRESSSGERGSYTWMKPFPRAQWIPHTSPKRHALPHGTHISSTESVKVKKSCFRLKIIKMGVVVVCI